MSDLDTKTFNDTDSSDDEEQYSKLISSVSQLDSTQRVKPASRKELSGEISEYNLKKGNNTNLVHVYDLAKVLKKKPKHISITNKLKKVTKKSKTLPKPLEKPAEDKLKRIIGYENVKSQLRRWNAVVERNSLKDHITFPLNNNTIKLENSNSFLNQFQTPTPLEKEMAEILNADQQPNKENERNNFPLTLEEMLEKRKEMAHMRAQLSYKQAKAQRQNKIKSKKYHQILKREKVRQQLKEFEILQKTDPEKALEKLTELDKNRALERASLRHRNTGQWAKNLTVRAKYDVESRKILAEQLKMSKEITRKVQTANSSDEETEDTLAQKKSNDAAKSFVVSKDNPWSLDVSKEFEDFISDYKKFWSEKNNESKKTELHEKTNEELNPPTEAKQETTFPINEENHSEQVNKNISNFTSLNEKSVLGKKSEKLLKKEKKKISIKSKEEKKNLTKKHVETLTSTPIKKETSLVTVQPTSGIWIITTVSEDPETHEQVVPRKKKKTANIDNLFNDLEDKLVQKAEIKVKKIKSELKKLEKLDKKKQLKVKKNKTNKFDLSLKNFNKIQRVDVDVGLLEGDTEENVNVPDANMCNASESGVSTNVDNVPVNDKTLAPEIDPKNFLKVKPKKLGTDFSGHTNTVEDAIDDELELQQNKIIEEAFGEDDVIAELNEMKNEDHKKEIISSCLPGWGEWGGTGLQPSTRKKKLFTVMLKTQRKDKEKRDMIINENANINIRNHLVTKIPQPFKTKEDFESNIRAPVGREWIPETAHRKLIQPAVETKLGSIINPMNEDEIVKLKKKHKSPYLGKIKQQKNS